MKSSAKPEIEHFRNFHLLDLMSGRHLNYLREKSVLRHIQKGDHIFSSPRHSTLGSYLVDGLVNLCERNSAPRYIAAGSEASRHALEEGVSDKAVAVAQEDCTVIQLDRLLVERYFSWSNTGIYKAVHVDSIGKKDAPPAEGKWMTPFLNSTLAKNLCQDDVKTLQALFAEKYLSKGEVVLQRGKRCNHFFIIKHGSGTMISADGNTRDLGTGDFFGEESLVPQAASSLRVSMTSDSCLACLEHRHFNRIIKKSLIRYVDDSQLDSLERVKFSVLDVRLPVEYKHGHSGQLNIPIQSLRRRLHELDRKRIYFISIESGARGELACYLLQQNGFRAYMLTHQQRETLRRECG